MIYVVIIGALIFAVFMSYTGLAEQVADFMEGLPGGTLMAIIIMTLLLLLLAVLCMVVLSIGAAIAQ